MTRLVRARVVPRLEAILRTRLSRFFLEERRRLEPGIRIAIAPIVDQRTKARDAVLLDRVEVALRSLAWDVEARLLRAILRPAYAITGEEAIAAVGSELGIGVSYDLNARGLAAIEKTLASRIVAINDRSRALIAGRVVDGIEKGLSLDQLVLGVRPGTSNIRGPVPTFAGIRDLVDGWASTGTGRVLGPVGSSADRQAGRVPPLRSTRAYLIAQTETGNAFNRSALEGYRTSGLVDFVEVFDGPDCGWSTHDDPDLAHGSIRKLDDAMKHSLSHPRCQRAFGAALGADRAKPSPSQGQPATNVPGATPGLRPDDVQPFGGRTVPLAPPRIPLEAPAAVSRESVLAEKGEAIRFLVDHEEAFAVDDLGNVVLDKTGVGPSTVRGTAGAVFFDDAELERIAGTTMTHNHPGALQGAGLLHATSFSPDDVSLYFVTKAREFRIVGKGADYSFSAPLELGPAITARFRSAWSEVRQIVGQAIEIEKAEARKAAKLPGGGFDVVAYGKAERAIFEKAERLHAQRAMEITVREFPSIRYQVTIR